MESVEIHDCYPDGKCQNTCFRMIGVLDDGEELSPLLCRFALQKSCENWIRNTAFTIGGSGQMPSGNDVIYPISGRFANLGHWGAWNWPIPFTDGGSGIVGVIRQWVEERLPDERITKKRQQDLRRVLRNDDQWKKAPDRLREQMAQSGKPAFSWVNGDQDVANIETVSVILQGLGLPSTPSTCNYLLWEMAHKQDDEPPVLPIRGTCVTSFTLLPGQTGGNAEVIHLVADIPRWVKVDLNKRVQTVKRQHNAWWKAHVQNLNPAMWGADDFYSFNGRPANKGPGKQDAINLSEGEISIDQAYDNEIKRRGAACKRKLSVEEGDKAKAAVRQRMHRIKKTGP